MHRTNRTNRFIASVALTTTAALGLVVTPGIASASTTESKYSAVAAVAPAPASVPVSGSVTNAAGVVSTFAWTLSNLTTTVVNGVLTLAGTLTGTASRQAAGR